jgi:hypothetical protein
MPLDRICIFGRDGTLAIEIPVIDLCGQRRRGDGQAEPDRDRGRAM